MPNNPKMWKLVDLTKQILIVDLTTGQIEKTEEDSDLYRSFLGGRGLNQFYLYNFLEPRTLPFGPENILIFGSGLLVGTATPSATRISIDSKNTFSNGVGSANAGEEFAPAMKQAGYGHLIILGKAKDPVYLCIDNDDIRIYPANDLWGMFTSETVDSLRKSLGKDIHVACIGPAGENLVRGGNIIVNKSRAAGKCGLGAVMGSKNLKAVVVHGTGGVQVAEPDEFAALCKKAWIKIKKSSAVETLATSGTKVGIKGKNALCAIAFRHFQDGHIEDLEALDEKAFAPYEQERFSCRGCPVKCRQSFYIDSGPYAGTKGEAVQCNTIQDFGTKLDIRYPPAIIKAHLLCNEYGMDMDTVAESTAWAFECFEKGLITKQDTGGLILEWGAHETLMTLINQIATREGFGDILAEGVKKAAGIIGRGQELAVSMKGQDLYEDPRIPKGYGLGAALATRGGGHCSGSPLVEFFAGGMASGPITPGRAKEVFETENAVDPTAYKGKAEMVAYHERLHGVLNSLGLCFFTSAWEGADLLDERDLAELVAAATGWDLDAAELMEIGERIHHVERLFNALHAGFDRKDDYPAERFFQEPIKSGPFKGELLHREQFDFMLDRNYSIHGWSERGLPTIERLEELSLPQRLRRLPGYLGCPTSIPAKKETVSRVILPKS